MRNRISQGRRAPNRNHGSRIGNLCRTAYQRGKEWLTRDSPGATRPKRVFRERLPQPQSLADFIGQSHVQSTLGVFIEAARIRAEALDHTLLVGPPGLGKTTLARIVASELGVRFHSTSGPVITKPEDLIALLVNLEHRDVLFVDEIHRLNRPVEELLYSAMQDFRVDTIARNGRSTHAIPRELPPFTLIGATTETGLLTKPLRDRFGIPVRLHFYSELDLETIVSRVSHIFGMQISPAAVNEIARRARGTPRIAERLVRRVRDFALVAGGGVIDRATAERALATIEVDAAGLDALDRHYLKTIALRYSGGPVGIAALVAALSESRETIEQVVEPFLVQNGFVQRTSRGRLLTREAFRLLGMTGMEPAPESSQSEQQQGAVRGTGEREVPVQPEPKDSVEAR